MMSYAPQYEHLKIQFQRTFNHFLKGTVARNNCLYFVVAGFVKAGRVETYADRNRHE